MHDAAKRMLSPGPTDLEVTQDTAFGDLPLGSWWELRKVNMIWPQT